MKNLQIKFSVSKGRDTYGYTIVTLIDDDKKYRTNGGGYDMIGTVFAQWLRDNYLDKIIEKVIPCEQESAPAFEPRKGTYGFFHRGGKYYLDGACGFSCMEDIALQIGLEVKRLYKNRGRELTNILIFSDKEESLR